MPSMKMGLRKGYAVKYKEGIFSVNVRELYGGEWFKTISPSFFFKSKRKEECEAVNCNILKKLKYFLG